MVAAIFDKVNILANQNNRYKICAIFDKCIGWSVKFYIFRKKSDTASYTKAKVCKYQNEYRFVKIDGIYDSYRSAKGNTDRLFKIYVHHFFRFNVRCPVMFILLSFIDDTGQI